MPSIFVVIVLYKMLPENSASFQSLQKSASVVPAGKLKLEILLYDNSPGSDHLHPSTPGVLYEKASRNAGLSGAYNRALEMANEKRFDWLLTLDQDTSLPPEFLPRITELAEMFPVGHRVAAIVPQISGDGRKVSPNWFRWGAFPSYLHHGYLGIPNHAMWAFNSASTVRVSALKQIGGYSSEFWLDNADSYLYRQLQRYNWLVFVAGDIQVEHDFSMLDIKNRMTIARYRNILISGGAFWDLYMGRLAQIEHTFRLFVRLVYKHRKNKDPQEMRDATREALIWRLFHSKKSRLQRWRADIAQHLDPAQEHSARETALTISVLVLDSERGQSERQLSNILEQIGPRDEVIFIDDNNMAGFDGPLSISKDARVKVIASEQSKDSLTAKLDKAIRGSSGNVLLLSNYDLIWKSDRIAKVSAAFRSNPNVEVVVAGANLAADRGGQFKTGSVPTQAHAAPFVRDIQESGLTGDASLSAIAFRSTLLPELLPLPKHKEFSIVDWIMKRATKSAFPIVYM